MTAPPALIDRPHRGDWLDRRRVGLCATILLALQGAYFLFVIAAAYGLIVPLDRPTSSDFTSFYAAGALAAAGDAPLAYVPAEHYRAEEQATRPGVEYKYFYYPPVFLLLCAALSLLPYAAAFLLFEGVGLALYLGVARAILDRADWAATATLLAFPAVFWTIALGQNAFLSAALFGAATLWIDRRPIPAGILFGLLCYKPHFALLVPIALIAGGYWRAVAAAASTAAALVLASLAGFGWDTWQGFLVYAASAHATYESGRIMLNTFVSPFGAVLLLGGPRALAYGVQIVATGAAAVLVGCAWRRQLRWPLRAAALTAATLAAVPVIFLYDLLIGAVAAAWLVRDGRDVPLSGAEKGVLTALFLLLAVSRTEVLWDVPIAPIAALGLNGLIAARVLRTHREFAGGRA